MDKIYSLYLVQFGANLLFILKSSMDRFIVVENACRKAIDDILKSSMDRFIVYTINH